MGKGPKLSILKGAQKKIWKGEGEKRGEIIRGGPGRWGATILEAARGSHEEEDQRVPPRLGSLATWQHREPFPQSNEEKTDYVDLGVNGRVE